jgi:hypothetical protein
MPCAPGEVCSTDVNCVNFADFPTPDPCSTLVECSNSGDCSTNVVCLNTPEPQSTNVLCQNLDECAGPTPAPQSTNVFAVNVPTPFPTTVCSGGGGSPCTSPLACDTCTDGLALLTNGTNCTGSNFAKGIDATGNAEGCAIPSTATALAANGTNCSGNQFAKGVDASGNAESCAIPPQIAADGANCGTNQFAQGVDMFGVAQGCAIPARLATNGSNCGANQFAQGVSDTGDAEGCAIPPTLAANASNCAAGTFAAGVDAQGAAEGCATPTVWIASGRFALGGAQAFFLYNTSATAAAAGSVFNAGTASALRCSTDVTPAAGKSYRFRIAVNGTASTVDCTISNPSLTCTDLVNTKSIVAGDLVTIQMDPSGGPATNNLACAFVMT